MHVAKRPVNIGGIDLKDVIVNKVRDVNLALNVSIEDRVCQIMCLDVLHEVVPVFAIAFYDSLGSVDSRRIQQVGGLDAIVVGQKPAVHVFSDLVNAPGFPIQKDQSRTAAEIVRQPPFRSRFQHLVADLPEHRQVGAPEPVDTLVGVTDQEKPLLERCVGWAADACEAWLGYGIAHTMNRFNGALPAD